MLYLILMFVFSVIAAVVLYLVYIYDIIRYKPMGRYEENDMRGKTVIITGANSGIGKEAAKELASKGAKIILACRDYIRAEQAANDIRMEITDANLVIKLVDVSSMPSVKKFAEEIIKEVPTVDVLINNAGTFLLPLQITDDGLDYTFKTNHMGPFLLTNLLLPKYIEGTRIINVSSIVHEIGEIKFDQFGELINFSPFKQYCSSKLANCLFTLELSLRMKNRRISVFSLSPGFVNTDILRHSKLSVSKKFSGLKNMLMNMISVSPKEGCETTVYCATASNIEHNSGCFYHNCRVYKLKNHGQDKENALRLWNYSESKLKQYL